MSLPTLTLSEIATRATITVDEAALLLGIGRSSAFSAIRRGDLPHIRIGRRLLVPVPQLLALIRGTNQPHPPEPARRPVNRI